MDSKTIRRLSCATLQGSPLCSERRLLRSSRRSPSLAILKNDHADEQYLVFHLAYANLFTPGVTLPHRSLDTLSIDKVKHAAYPSVVGTVVPSSLRRYLKTTKAASTEE